jgi:DNA/RNA-binding domain of Phe-tRNA-synthetase-like protein
MLLYVENSATTLGVVNPVSAVISNVSVIQKYDGDLRTRIEEEYCRIKEQADAIIASESASGFRALFAGMGYPELMPAGERLITSFLERGFKSINNLVDAYNIVSMKYCAGIGMHDADLVVSDVFVRRAQGGEQIVPIFQSKNKSIKAGDLIYLAGAEPMAWLGKRDVDSDKFKVTDDTKRIFVIALGNKNTPRATNVEVVNEIFVNIKLSCPAAEVEFVPTYVCS